MRKSILLIAIICFMVVLAGLGFAQPTSTIPGGKNVFVTEFLEPTSGSYIALQYRAISTPIFYEPVTGYIAIGMRKWDGAEGAGLIEVNVSLDGGDTWIQTDRINEGIIGSTGIDGGYTSEMWGNETTPIIFYTNRANDDANIEYEPIMAYDLFGWGGGIFENVSIDNYSATDTITHYRYLDAVVAPDDPNLWYVSGWHHNSDAPGELLVMWKSTDGGVTWSRPKAPISAVAADAGQARYYYNIMSGGAKINAGPGGMVYMFGETQKDSSGDIYKGVYSMSSDYGETWTDPAYVPGTEDNITNNLNNATENKIAIVDQAGNYHLIQAVVDTTDTNAVRYYLYCRYDGSTWDVSTMARPQREDLFNNGLTRQGREAPGALSMDGDGTIYFTYMDLADTAGGYSYDTYAKFTEDNGVTWQGPVKIGEGFNTLAYASDVARNASDVLHIMYNVYDEVVDTLNKVYYMSIPTAGIKTGVSVSSKETVPEEFDLQQNYPNPFNPTTTIEFSLATKTHVNITIFNSLGQNVETLVDKAMTAGKKAVVWYASDMPSGTYYYKMKAGDIVQTKEMVLVK